MFPVLIPELWCLRNRATRSLFSCNPRTSRQIVF